MKNEDEILAEALKLCSELTNSMTRVSVDESKCDDDNYYDLVETLELVKKMNTRIMSDYDIPMYQHSVISLVTYEATVLIRKIDEITKRRARVKK